MAFKCGGGTENPNPWRITRTPTTGQPEQEEIHVRNFDPTTGEITGRHRQNGMPETRVKGHCNDSPTDTIVFLRPIPNPVLLYIGTVTEDANGSHARGTYSRIGGGGNRNLTDEGTWIGERPPPFLFTGEDSRSTSQRTDEADADTPDVKQTDKQPTPSES